MSQPLAGHCGEDKSNLKCKSLEFDNVTTRLYGCVEVRRVVELPARKVHGQTSEA